MDTKQLGREIFEAQSYEGSYTQVAPSNWTSHWYYCSVLWPTRQASRVRRACASVLECNSTVEEVTYVQNDEALHIQWLILQAPRQRPGPPAVGDI
ncbi:hypothetical protein PM082_009302 [Marasmius tenuissimus]|nr:hypothetical protein PM082_009302 [Marasmius tenuissimus]